MLFRVSETRKTLEVTSATNYHGFRNNTQLVWGYEGVWYSQCEKHFTCGFPGKNRFAVGFAIGFTDLDTNFQNKNDKKFSYLLIKCM